MNPAFIFLMIIFAILIWVLCVYLFMPIGNFIKKIINKINNTITKEDDDKGENKNETNKR